MQRERRTADLHNSLTSGDTNLPATFSTFALASSAVHNFLPQPRKVFHQLFFKLNFDVFVYSHSFSRLENSLYIFLVLSVTCLSLSLSSSHFRAIFFPQCACYSGLWRMAEFGLGLWSSSLEKRAGVTV